MPIHASACLQATMVRERAISPVELVEAHLRQIDAVNPAINAFVEICRDEALAAARIAESAVTRGEIPGLLHGIPVTVKDSFDMEGRGTLTGSPLRKGHKAAQDAAVVRRLREAGAIVLGRTNTPELLSTYETDNSITGRTNNPWDLERTPGGSSGGEAAAIAAFCSAGGVGSDGGGSIRVPAHFCGIAGLKPTPGRISSVGHFPVISNPSGFVSVAGPMARTAEDLRLFFAALAGYDPEDAWSAPVPVRPPAIDAIRVGVWPRFGEVKVTPEVADAVDRAAKLLGDIGVPTDAFEPRGLERAPNLWWFLFGQMPSIFLRQVYQGREEEMHWTARELLGQGEGAPAPTAQEIMLSFAGRDRMRARLLRDMEKFPVLLAPVCGVAAFPHRARRYPVGDTSIGLFQAMMQATVANLLGLPAVTIPIFVTNEGLPVGVQLIGRPWEEENLLEIAARLEAARGPFPGPAIF